jgi:predicted nucleotidyltransferase
MRIPKEQLIFIKERVLQEFPEAKVYVFGSRVDDNKRGGDIDILILTSHRMIFIQESKIRLAFTKKFGDQKLDLVNFTFDDDDVFKKLVLIDAVEI